MIQNKKHEVQELSKRMKETIKRIQVTVHMVLILLTGCVPQDGAGIIGVMLYTPDGIPIRTTVDNTTAAQYQNLVSHLTAAARSRKQTFAKFEFSQSRRFQGLLRVERDISLSLMIFVLVSQFHFYFYLLCCGLMPI